MNTSLARPMSVKLDQETRARIEQLARTRRRTAHWMLREAVLQYLDREEKNEAYRQDGLRAWETYQTNGQHLTQEEADVWLAQLEAGQDNGPPACHG